MRYLFILIIFISCLQDKGTIPWEYPNNNIEAYYKLTKHHFSFGKKFVEFDSNVIPGIWSNNTTFVAKDNSVLIRSNDGILFNGTLYQIKQP